MTTTQRRGCRAPSCRRGCHHESGGGCTDTRRHMPPVVRRRSSHRGSCKPLESVTHGRVNEAIQSWAHRSFRTSPCGIPSSDKAAKSVQRQALLAPPQARFPVASNRPAGCLTWSSSVSVTVRLYISIRIGKCPVTRQLSQGHSSTRVGSFPVR